MDNLGFMASLAMGLTLGLMGGGGSILTVPILVYLFALTPTIATGYSLFIVGITALAGSFVYFRKREIDFRAGLIFALPSLVGVNLSRGFVLPRIPVVIVEWAGFSLTREVFIMLIFAILMLLASFSMIRRKTSEKMEKMHPRKNTKTGPWRVALQGLMVGLIVGFVGAGGGFLIIPALVFMAGLQMRVAVGTSLMIIALQSLLGFAADLYRGFDVDWLLLGTVSLFAILGIMMGSALSHKVKEQSLKIAFGYFVLVMGLGILTEQLRHLSL